jgi:hypothetical protein
MHGHLDLFIFSTSCLVNKLCLLSGHGLFAIYASDLDFHPTLPLSLSALHSDLASTFAT